MKIQGRIRYHFEITARDLTHVRHALNLAIENSSGGKKQKFIEIHDEITKQVTTTTKDFEHHFKAVLEMEVKGGEE